jgi:hypothetical protein
MRCAVPASILAVLLFLAVPRSEAVTIGLEPVASSATVGSLLDLRFVISGLGSGAAPSLSAFEVDIAFDGDILAFEQVTFGDPALGDQLDLSGFGSLTEAVPGPGVVTLIGISVDDPIDLDASQADTFVVATLVFRAVGAGLAPVDISRAILGDAAGTELPSLMTPPATVEVTGIAVPEPALLWLTLAGAAAFASKRRRR